MLNFHHVYGYTIFPAIQEFGGKWVGLTRIHAGERLVMSLPVAGKYNSHDEAFVAASADAAGVADTIRTMV